MFRYLLGPMRGHSNRGSLWGCPQLSCHGGPEEDTGGVPPSLFPTGKLFVLSGLKPKDSHLPSRGVCKVTPIPPWRPPLLPETLSCAFPGLPCLQGLHVLSLHRAVHTPRFLYHRPNRKYVLLYHEHLKQAQQIAVTLVKGVILLRSILDA